MNFKGQNQEFINYLQLEDINGTIYRKYINWRKRFSANPMRFKI